MTQFIQFHLFKHHLLFCWEWTILHKKKWNSNKIKNMNNLIVKFYVNKDSKIIIAELMSNINFRNRDNFELDVIKNDEFDEEKSLIFPDGFIHFPFFIEYYKNDTVIMEEDIINSKMILQYFWQNKIPLVRRSVFAPSG